MSKYEVDVIHEHRYTIEADTLKKAMKKGEKLAEKDMGYDDIKHHSTYGYTEETNESEKNQSDL